MKRSLSKGLRDYLALLVRRRWWVIVPFVALSALTVLVSRLLPKIYVSESMVLIQPRDVPTDFVKDLIAGSTDERLNVIEQQILSRSNLLKILTEFEQSLVGYRGFNDEKKVLKLNKRIHIDVNQER